MAPLDEGDAHVQGDIATMEGQRIALGVVLESLPDAVVVSDRHGRIVFVNARAEELFGYSREQVAGRPVEMLWPERVRARYTRNAQRHFATESPERFTTEAWGVRSDGSEFAGEMSWGVIESDSGPLMLAIGRDISARRATEARLRAVAMLGERALAGADATSLAAEAADLMQAHLPIVGTEIRLADGTVLARAGTTAEPGLRIPIGTGDTVLLAPAQELSFEEMGLVRALADTLATALDRLRDEERARHDAVHDPLTGLANRTLLRDRLRHAVARSSRTSTSSAVLFVDIDRFKEINDRYGHAAGDEALVELARRLGGAVRPGDTVARYGGDEFVAVCENVDAEAAMIVASRILDAVRRPLRAAGVTHTLSASVGVALGGADAEALLADADAAAYRAKANGRDRVERQ